jgi:hypothetical protein
LRDGFADDVRRVIAARAGHLCSHPDCRAQTAGPQVDESKALNVGVAAHITGASPGGPRFNANLSVEERTGAENGIWLCQTHAKLVDNDSTRFTVETVRDWKRAAERRALSQIGMPTPVAPESEADRKAGAILPWKGKVVSLAVMNTGKAVTLLGLVRAYSQVTVIDCNEFAVTFSFGGSTRSVPLASIDVSFDNVRGRLELQERHL